MATKRLPTEQRRAQLAEVALRLIAEHGPAGLTLAELGEAVGIADASVLRHFKDKRAIVDAAIDLFGQLLEGDMAEDLEDPLKRLGAFFVRRLNKVRARPELMGLAYNSRLRDAAAEDGAARVDAHIARSADFIRKCLVDAQAAGQLSPDVPVEIWVWTVAGILRGASHGLPPGLTRNEAKRPMSSERTWELVERLMKSA